ncbi:uncharacterized protein [Dipodomys merriami]|uniref:uncharacterized protein isoform X7 n=1 Tax=Dipodomys merriami TaxID=94247 RepID=UPI003855CE86
MSRSLLLSLLTLLSCFRVLSGSFAEKESSACRDGSLRSSKKMKRARKKEGMDSISNTQVAIDKHDSGCVTLCSLVKSALEEEESAQPQQKRPVQLGCCTKRIVHSG